MREPVRPRLAPVFDAVCIVVFVLVGRGRHHIDEGAGWFFTVLWPLFVGWFGVAIATRLYTRSTGIWRALTITWLGGLFVMVILRGTFTDRPYVGIFTVIAVAFIGFLTFGWRVVATAIARGRRGARTITP